MHLRLRVHPVLTGTALALAFAGQAAAQSNIPSDDPGIKRAFAAIQSWNSWIIDNQVSLCEIPAPPFKEQARGIEFRKRMIALGYPDTKIDAIGNVIAERAGRGNGPTVLITGHLDTVFPEGTDVKVRRTGTRLDGTGFDVTSRAVGSHRYNVVFTGPGGHSYGAFGNVPSAIHAMGRAISNVGDLVPPAGLKTTYNVGVVKGGTSVNTISPDAAMEVDMRSESVDNLTKMDQLIHDAIAKGVAAENGRWPRAPGKVTVKYDTIGIRPVGRIVQNDSTPIVKVALDAAKALGLPTSPSGSGSTDSNLPMSMGIPAMTIDGGGRGGNAHAAGEWYDDGTDGYKGPQWALLIVAALAGIARTTTP